MNALEKLQAPFSRKEVRFKVGKTNADKTEAQALPFIPPMQVQARLDEVLGLGGWQDEYIEVMAENRLFAVRCRLSVFVDGRWVVREGAAPFLVGRDSDSDAGESAVKAVYADALRMAAVKFGVGRYLYNYPVETHKLVQGRRVFEVSPELLPQYCPEGEREQAPSAAVAVKPETAAPAPQKQPSGEAKAQEPVRAAASEPSTSSQDAQPAAAQAPAEPELPPAQARAVDEADRSTQAEEPSSPAQADKPQEPVEQDAPANAADSDESLPEGFPRGLAEDVKRLTLDMLHKVSVVQPETLRSYLNSPKGSKKFPPEARDFLLSKIDERVGKAA